MSDDLIHHQASDGIICPLCGKEWDDPSVRCGVASNRPNYPYRCIRDAGHEGDHGYAGVFWR